MRMWRRSANVSRRLSPISAHASGGSGSVAIISE
jgi:hypothetical protein